MNKELITKVVTRACPFCEKVSRVKVPEDEWFAFMNGQLPQKCLKSLSPTEREILITGICKDCQDEFFEL